MMKKMLRCVLAVAMVVSSLTLSAINLSAESTNIALGKTAVADSIEASSLNASKAFDGDTSDRTSRWSCAEGTGSHWLYVDLGAKKSVGTVRLYWENRKATSYKIQVADTLSNPMAESDWTNAKVIDGRPSSTTDTIYLPEGTEGRYVRVYIDGLTREDPDGGVEWPTVSIYEFEVYETLPPLSIEDLKNQITVETPEAGDRELTVNIPEIPGYEIKYNGTDLEQVIDADLNIHRPIISKTVNVSFKLTSKTNPKDYAFKEVAVTVPGMMDDYVADDANAPLEVLPELAEWAGLKGVVYPSEMTEIVYNHSIFEFAATELAREMKEMYGYELAVSYNPELSLTEVPENNKIYIVKNPENSGLTGLGEEGYYMYIGDNGSNSTVANRISITADHATGAYWSTRTILQAMMEDAENHTLRCGYTRDYPLYRVRGIILDVGRKTFTMDYLQQMAKQMAWYKMNDFQIHLNDNYIFLEEYSRDGADPMSAYAAFRLESDVKEGGNNGLNKADLTAKDVFYTKDEFRDFIQTSRKMGVNIVPEIDTPAHSLAFTKVRPDLRNGTYGRENDHLNLMDKYDQTMEFIQGIFAEYMTEENPVFDEETTVHIGADEYNASSEGYRKYVNDMFDFVQDSGRQVRVWGSFTAAKTGEPIDGTGVEINLWNYGYANWDTMYEKGFNMINCDDGLFYVVPNADYYGDYFNANNCYNRDLMQLNNVDIPAGDPQATGAAIALWNDMIDRRENGMSEYDLYVRLAGGIPMLAANTWGKGSKTLAQAQDLAAILGDAPGTNFAYDVEKTEDGVVLHNNFNEFNEVKNAELKEVESKQVLELMGGESFVKTALTTVGLENTLRVKVKRMSAENTDQILFESVYGNIKAVNKNGKVSFYRENHEYEFNYELPVGQWVELEFKNEFEIFSLYVNGEFKQAVGTNTRNKEKATMMFPVERIGSTTNAFVGYVDDVRLGTTEEFFTTMPLDNAVGVAYGVNQEANDAELTALIAQANELVSQYAASEADVMALRDAIAAKLDTIDYEKADYSKWNALAAIVTDLSAYTEASASVVRNVLNSVRLGLPATNQEEVDLACASLEAAIAKLQIKVAADLNFVDPSTITATASTYQNDGSYPSNVLDGDSSTMWHTDWNVTTMPHWIDFKLSESTEVNGITYLPRSGAGNGTATSYEIRISNDNGATYQTVKTGTLDGSYKNHEITFERVAATNVRFVLVAAKNNNGSAAEMKVSKASVVADFAGLNAAIEAAKAVKANNYTEESFAALQAAIEAAESLAADPNAAAGAVEEAKYELARKRAALVVEVKEEQPEVPQPTVPAKVENVKAKDTNYKTITLT